MLHGTCVVARLCRNKMRDSCVTVEGGAAGAGWGGVQLPLFNNYQPLDAHDR